MAVLAAVVWLVVAGAAAKQVRRAWSRAGAAAGAEERWAEHKVLAVAIATFAHGAPLVAGLATSLALSRAVPTAATTTGAVLRWLVLAASCTGVLLAVDRLTRRLLPLAALLRLSMLFPDGAPRRMAVAAKAGTVRALQRRLDAARDAGDADLTTAAERILALAGALHGHDRRTRGHSERVRWYVELVAEELGLTEADRDRLRWTALLHDIGKLHVSRRILNKPGKLRPSEWSAIHRHPTEGARLIGPLADWLGPWAAAVAHHHERYDGTGYPHRLRGDDISLGGRIVAVADAYEVMTSVRSYKAAKSAKAARAELAACAGTHFDPAIVRAFLNISVSRLLWVRGPLAWLAQIPLVGSVPRLAADSVALAGQGLAAAGATVAIAGAGGAATVTPPSASTPPDAGATPAAVTSQTPASSTLLRLHASSLSSTAPAPSPADTLPSTTPAAVTATTLPAANANSPQATAHAATKHAPTPPAATTAPTPASAPATDHTTASTVRQGAAAGR